MAVQCFSEYGMAVVTLLEEKGESHTYSAAPAAKAEQQSSLDPALPSAHHPLLQLAAPYQTWEKFQIKVIIIRNCTQLSHFQLMR